MTDSSSTARDYRETLFLPKTDFPMRAGLPKAEPKWLARWNEIGLYQKQREAENAKGPWTLHDGPPYANGHLHIGHALNKTIKDMIVRSHQMMGFDARYIPGWDCHGLEGQKYASSNLWFLLSLSIRMLISPKKLLLLNYQ